ncbi:rhomboid family intramembrane serine protease [Rhodothermus profundi]|uniref:Membrane associated serine protease, rhomboid family n=1 Tax=Rhodothermus profundi TaxID=633813 RepID=A0A1M6SIK2_9BACT|nr:rhomboid family intramembrane serine protease [Rhodothermus profundi]SHK44561.1 Membrane associated serine protease, rhomboid family [Rhodothermus profundi]
MIPIGDDIPERHYPFVTYTLIGLNVFFFFVELLQGPRLEAFLYRWGTVPAWIMNWQEQPEVLLTLFTSMFLHGGFAHLIGNMLYLNVYGKSLEGTIGSGRFLAFYLLSGLAGGIAHVLMNPTSTVPAIGASGAISGVLGAYLVLFPRATVFLAVPLLFFFPIIALPAAFVLTWWFALQIVGGLTSAAFTQVGGGVAYWAHIGGFVAGLLLIGLFYSRKRRQPFRYYGVPDRRYWAYWEG